MKIKEILAAAVLASSSVSPTSVLAQETRHEDLKKKIPDQGGVDKKGNVQQPEISVPYVYTGPLFKVDDYISAHEGMVDERQALVRELADELVSTPIQNNKDSQGRVYTFYRKVYPLIVDGKRYDIIASLYPEHDMLAVAVVDPLRPGETPIVLRDEGLTGTPTVHQLPIQLQDKKIPQGFAVFSEDSIATKLYYGLLKHMLSKF